MKNSLIFSPLLFCLLGFGLNTTLSTPDTVSLGLELPKPRAVAHSALTTPHLICDTPTGLYTTNITETTATLNWSPVSGAQNYSVQTRLPYGTWYYVPGSPFTNTSVTVDGLSPGTMYEWRVRANCDYGNQSYWSSPVSFTTSGTISCTAPDWLNTLNITQTTATWDWSPVSGAQSYSVQWRYAGGTWHTLYGGPWTYTLLNVGGLQPGTTYEWRVRSNCYNGMTSDWSYSASFTTLDYSSCSKPTGLYTTNITETTATLNWSPVAGAESYSVQTRLPNGTWYYVPGSPFTNTSVTVDGLSPGTTYEWRVRANCDYWNKSYWTSPVSFTTNGTSSCSAPDGLTTLNITQTTATWDWSPVSGAHSYSVQWRYPGGTWHNLYGGPWTYTLLNIHGLQPGTTYEWRVRSNCYNGMTSDWSYSVSFTTPGYSCTKPTGLYTTNITETTATLNWSPVAGAQSYSVQTRLPNGIWHYVPGSPFTGTSVTVDGLSPGTTYEWRVRSNCDYWNKSYWTSPASFTTSGTFSCIAPDVLTTLNITQTTATWDWSPVGGAHSYSVQWRYPGGTWHNLYGGPWTYTLLNIHGLQPGTTYEWRVRSNCYNGMTSDWSYSASFTTLDYSTCTKPTGLHTTDITETTATLNWSPVPGAQSYSVQTRLPYGSWYYVPGSPFTDTSVTVDGLSPGTTYEWRVRANCDYWNKSYWTSPVSFTTSGSGNTNDNCSNATLLTVGSSCVNASGSNINATASSPSPAGGCPSDGYKDVWFRFTMPDVSNPAVTIRTTSGSLTDAVMEVYVGADCSSLSYLTCEDDNTNGNGSNMPVINLIGYPNAQIWVRVWGYDGSTGTFNICVFDYLSNNLASDGDTDVIPISGEQLEQAESESEKVQSPDKHDVSPLLRIAPNPVSDILSITFSQTEECIVSGIVLTDISGKLVVRKEYQSGNFNEFHEELEVSGLIPGVYVLQVVTTTGMYSEKVSVVDN